MMADSSASYIHMVHRLIEECLLFKMSKEECMEALSKHANINPIITSTVWNELEKENKEFFRAYSGRRMNDHEKGVMMSDHHVDAKQIIKGLLISNSASPSKSKD